MDFVHPSYAKFEIVNDIIESIYEYHGYDIQSHHVIDDHNEEEPPRKRRRVTPTSADQNDNSFAEEAVESLEGEENSPENEEVLNPYLQLRQNNIREREEMAKELGIIPHSEEII